MAPKDDPMTRLENLLGGLECPYTIASREGKMFVICSNWKEANKAIAALIHEGIYVQCQEIVEIEVLNA